MHTLSLNSVHLVDLIDANDALINELACPAVHCITSPQRDYLVSIGHLQERNGKLLKLLTYRSVDSFKQFTRILSKYQAHLVPLLVADGGEIFLV